MATPAAVVPADGFGMARPAVAGGGDAGPSAYEALARGAPCFIRLTGLPSPVAASGADSTAIPGPAFSGATGPQQQHQRSTLQLDQASLPPSDVLVDVIDASSEDPFTLESFQSLARLHALAGKDFLIARVVTLDPDDPSREYFSYYAAHHINKILFRTQPEQGLLHRMRAKNPLNNMTIVGDVNYYVVRAAHMRAFLGGDADAAATLGATGATDVLMSPTGSLRSHASATSLAGSSPTSVVREFTLLRHTLDLTRGAVAPATPSIASEPAPITAGTTTATGAGAGPAARVGDLIRRVHHALQIDPPSTTRVHFYAAAPTQDPDIDHDVTDTTLVHDHVVLEVPASGGGGTGKRPAIPSTVTTAVDDDGDNSDNDGGRRTAAPAAAALSSSSSSELLPLPATQSQSPSPLPSQPVSRRLSVVTPPRLSRRNSEDDAYTQRTTAESLQGGVRGSGASLDLRRLAPAHYDVAVPDTSIPDAAYASATARFAATRHTLHGRIRSKSFFNATHGQIDVSTWLEDHARLNAPAGHAADAHVAASIGMPAQGMAAPRRGPGLPAIMTHDVDGHDPDPDKASTTQIETPSMTKPYRRPNSPVKRARDAETVAVVVAPNAGSPSGAVGPRSPRDKLVDGRAESAAARGATQKTARPPSGAADVALVLSAAHAAPVPPSPLGRLRGAAVIDAAFFATDDDFLMKSDVRAFFKRNALEGDDAVLFTIASVQMAGAGAGGAGHLFLSGLGDGHGGGDRLSERGWGRSPRVPHPLLPNMAFELEPGAERWSWTRVVQVIRALRYVILFYVVAAVMVCVFAVPLAYLWLAVVLLVAGLAAGILIFV